VFITSSLGTLIEQYPSLISTIVVINAPTFISVLWNAICAFIPADYKRKIHLLGTNWAEKLPGLGVPVASLPASHYPGGQRMSVGIVEPKPCTVPAPHPFAAQLELHTAKDWSCGAVGSVGVMAVVIPAGGFVVHSYYLTASQLTEFYMRHEKEFTMNVYYTATRRQYTVGDELAGAGEGVCEEAFAGCERPGMPTMDYWLWTVPQTGFYHVVFGNEKAWLMSVEMRYQLYELVGGDRGGVRVKVQPLPPIGQ